MNAPGGGGGGGEPARVYTQEELDAALAFLQEQLRRQSEQLQQLQQRERERVQFEEGTFYSNIDQVWSPTGSGTRSLRGHMQLLRRETCPLFFTRRDNPDGEGINPYLVTREHAFRAGVAWSSRHGQKMLAAVEPQDEDDDLSDMSYDQYLADYADAIRAEDPESLARGLHQEGGCVEGTVS